MEKHKIGKKIAFIGVDYQKKIATTLYQSVEVEEPRSITEHAGSVLQCLVAVTVAHFYNIARVR